MEMVIAMMKQIKFNVALTVVTAAIPVFLKIFANNASVSMKMIGKVPIHLLEMVTVRMSQIMEIVAMMEEIAVYLMLLLINAQIALVMLLRLVQLEFFLQHGMAIAMMTQILNNVILMGETAA